MKSPREIALLLWRRSPVADRSLLDRANRLSGQDALAVRAGKRLRNEELLVPALAGTRLRMELDRIPLWRGDHVANKHLADDFARYPYLPRLRDSHVRSAAVQDGLGLLLWREESFAYVDSFDETAVRYRGLRFGQRAGLSHDNLAGLLVKPDVALGQQLAEVVPTPGPARGGEEGGKASPKVDGMTNGQSTSIAPTHVPKRFYGTVTLDPTRVGRDAGCIADEIVAPLAGLMGSSVKVTLEIDAEVPTGVPERIVRTVTENTAEPLSSVPMGLSKNEKS